MSKLIFDLKENGIEFNSFEILTFERNKNSPSASTLRGKGAMFFAENFSYIDKFTLKFKIKNTNNNYQTSELTDLQKLRRLYSKYRIKGLVFLENEELFNKIFAGIIYNSNQDFIKIAIKQLNFKESMLDKLEFDKLEKETKELLFKMNMLNTYEQALQIFPNLTNGEFLLLKEKYEKEYQVQSMPFLTCLHKINFMTIPDSSDGLEVEMTIGIIKDLINYDSLFIESYKDKEKEFSNFFNEINQKIISIENEKNNLHLKFTDYSKQRMFLTEKQNDLNDTLNKSYLNEHDINLSEEDISQFQFITYNNIAEIPIQGQSSTLKQLIGLGESNLTIKILFKNDKSENFQKLKMINSLLNKDQRQLKGIIDFPFINILDFKSVEFSDFFYSNDSNSDAVFATLILKLNAYNNHGIEINSFGETIDETFSATSKNRSANIPLVYSSFYNFNKILGQEDLNKVKEIVIHSEKSEQFKYSDLMECYYNGSSIKNLYIKTSKENAQKLNDIDKLNLLNNFMSNNYQTYNKNTKGLDIIGLLPLLDFLNSYLYIGFETNSFDLSLENSNNQKYKEILTTNIKTIYDESLYYIAQSMFPSLTNNLLEDNYYYNETVKGVILDYLTSLPVFILNAINEIKINDENLNQLFKYNKYFNSNTNELIVEKIIKYCFKNIKNRLKDEDLINKIITAFNLNKINNEKSFNKDSLPITIEEITKNVINSLERISFDLDLYLNTTDDYNNNFFEIIKNQILSIFEIRKMTYRLNLNEFSSGASSDEMNQIKDKIEEATKNSIYIFDKIDIISLSLVSILCNSFGISNSYFGTIHNLAAEEIVDIGIKATMLASNTESKETIFNSIESIFGKDFCSENGAITFYNSLTSNIALTDLGSYLGIYCKDNSGEYSAIFNVLIKNLLNDNYLHKAKEEYFDLLKEESNNFYVDTKTYQDALENFYVQTKSGNKEEKKEDIEKTLKNFNESITGVDRLTKLYDAQFNNKNAYLKDFNSQDLRSQRIKNMTMGLDYLKQLNNTFSPNLQYSLPTYDIYIFQKTNYFNAPTRIGIQKIENYLGIDKVIDINIGFAEATRSKIAIIKTLDTSENIKPYNFKLKSNINIGLESLNGKISNSNTTDYYSKTKQELKIGDEISIYMGFCNENKLVFNGIIQKVTEGKVKTIECINYSYQLSSNLIDLRLAENLPLVDPYNTISKIKNNYKDSYSSLTKTKINSININDPFIPSNFFNTNYNHINLTGETVSTYNIIFHGLANNLLYMKNFKQNKRPSLTEIRNASKDWYDIDLTNAWFKQNKETFDSNLVVNINNVDRDLSFYGIGIKDENKNTTSDTLKAGYKSSKSSIPSNIIPPASTYCNSDITEIGSGTSYEISNGTMKEILCDMEKRIPGVYWDVIDSGYGATLFYGRHNYNLLIRKTRSDYEFSKTESNYFENKFLKIQDEIINMNKLNLFLTLQNILLSTTGVSKEPIDDKGNSGDFLDNSDYETARNLIFATTNKNLISNKIVINSNVPNKIKIKYTSSILQKIKNILNGNTMMSTSIYAFGSLRDLEDDEAYSERLKEKVIEDDNIRNTKQSIESGVARLQIELENYYSGKIIILFEPNIRYRSEVVIFDSINNIYGSILVKDFEHKFDSKGSYTIITPMMKIESLNVSKDTFQTSFWTRLFYDRRNEKTKASECAASLNALFNKNKSNLTITTLYEIVKNKVNEKPVILKNFSFDITNKKFVDLEIIGLQPLVFYPLLKRNEYLLPDADIYSVQQRKHFSKLTNWFNRITLSTVSFFKFQKEYQNTMEQNFIQKTFNYFAKRLDNISNVKEEEINRLNFDTVFGLKHKDQISQYVYNQMKTVMFKDLYDFKLNNEIPEKTFNNKNSFGFFNTKVLHYNSDEIKFENISKVISNFDFMNLVEISDFNSSTNKKEGKQIIEKIGKKLIEKLNKIKLDNSFEWIYENPVLIRENAMTHEDKKNGDEYYLCIRKKYLNLEDTNHVIANIDKTLSITVDVNPLNNFDKNNITINIPVYNIVCKNNKSFKMLIFHNIYFGNNLKSNTDQNIFKVLAIKQFFALINKINDTKIPLMVFGDYNISMIKYSLNSNEIYSPVLGEVLMIDSYGTEDLTVKGSSFTPMIKPHTLTTLGLKANKNSFDNILINDVFENKIISKTDNFKYGVFYEAKYKTNKESVEYLSDHYPVYITLK